MVCEVKACAECTRRCLSVHSKKDHRPETVSTSFFKVMIGDEFSAFLFLPPKFARTVRMLVNQKVNLEDALGQRWQVTISNARGSFAFQEGWHVFSLDHGLQVGDFLWFQYFEGSHFFVKIYKRTGCECLNFPWNPNNCKKRKPACKDSVERNASCHTVDKSSIDKQSLTAVSGVTQSSFNVNNVEESPKSKQVAKICENSFSAHLPVAHQGCIDELLCIPDRNLGYRGDHRNTSFDLSIFEMRNAKAGAGGNEEASVDHGGKHQNSTEAGFSGYGSADNKLPLKKDILAECVERPCNDQNTNLDTSKKKRTAAIFRCGHAGKLSNVSDVTGNLPLKNNNNEVQGIVKAEPVELPLPNTASISCLVPTDVPSFLELPGCLPLLYKKRRLRQGRAVVVLKDPMMREWAVVYHERYELKVLGDGWEAFCKGNGIRGGETCSFEVETQPSRSREDLYRVHIAAIAH